MNGTRNLRRLIGESKAWYKRHYGRLNWQWYDEGLPYTILDYHSSLGSILDFTKYDIAACAENGWNWGELLELCGDEERSNV